MLDHFKVFLGTSQSRIGVFDSTLFHENFVSNNDWELLCKIPSRRKIKEALQSIKDDKIPRHDGFNSLFYKKAWRIVGEEICMEVKDFFTNGKMLKQANAT